MAANQNRKILASGEGGLRGAMGEALGDRRPLLGGSRSRVNRIVQLHLLHNDVLSGRRLSLFDGVSQLAHALSMPH
jgi:hypothetical protein